MSAYLSTLNHALMITVFVFIMMVIVDYMNVLTKGRLTSMMRGQRFRQYTVASFLGATPGCLGSFLNVSFYVRGLLSFGAIVGAMIATSGDEAYVMLAMFPRTALLLFFILFILGIFFAWITDKLVPIFKIIPCEECKLAPLHLDDSECFCFDVSFWKRFPNVLISRIIVIIISIAFILSLAFNFIGPKSWGWEKISLFVLLIISVAIFTTTPDHYLREHIWHHIFKKHIWRVFLWTLFALLLVQIGLEYWNLSAFVKANPLSILFISAFIGIIPESGPHLIFVTMFAKGLIPFSVLLTSSFIQDGHGMLPLLSYSVKDSILIKLFNIAFGLAVGLLFFGLGL
ncbi:selenocysteine protein [candidate division WOR-3 bacterium 4484_100]|uniref:Selenocysteine protein n=1 Tax=candidate division WOR-3 bacterium 4484_100 TaxID=1936077 RepID=A0A1V4QF42_UNCW3|nr:MAG: selenocysteine protein [candidate division WOR-3 bacterium 4484_100]